MNRAKKLGLELEEQKKLDQQYEDEVAAGTPTRVMTWMNTVLEGTVLPCGDANFRKFQFHLRDGTVLCKLINKLLESDGKPPVKFKGINTNVAVVALDNISSFNKGAEQYGVGKDFLFTNTDLYEGYKGPFVKVLLCLSQLGVMANEKGFSPQFEVVVNGANHH